MEASRELDAKIAEVMGDRLCYHELHETKPVCKHCYINKSFWWPKWGRGQPPWYYSSDMNAAMGAAEKTGLFKRYKLAQWQDNRWIIEDIHGGVFAQAEAPALAICSAVLKSAGEEA